MAVYTEVSFEELERLLEQYDIGTPLSFKGIAEGIENSNYYLQTDRGAFILTLYEKRVAAQDLPFFLGLMEYLSGRGVHCPLPVKTRDGQSARLHFLDRLAWAKLCSRNRSQSKCSATPNRSFNWT